MTAHDHTTVVTGCYRCDLNRDELGIADDTFTCEPSNGAHRYRAHHDTCDCGDRSRADLESMFTEDEL